MHRYLRDLVCWDGYHAGLCQPDQRVYLVKNKNLTSTVVTVLVLAVLPLPLALALTGVEGILHGSAAALKEFLVSYLFGLFTLLVGLGWFLWNNRDSKQQKK